MTQGPWSVKGIDPKARSVARENAQRRGITLGQYLNTLLLDDGEDDSDDHPLPEPRRIERIERAEGPRELQSITDELDDLSKRLEAAQDRSAKAITGVDRSILDLQDRVEETGRANTEAVERVTAALKEIQSAQVALRDRVQQVETDNSSHVTLDALHKLEQSLARLARNVEDRSALDHKLENLDNTIAEAVKSSTHQLNSRVGLIDERMSKVQDRMDGAISRMNETSNRFEAFETRTQRSVADTAKLMERALDANTTRSRAISKELSQRVESIEGQTRTAVNSLGDAVSRIIDRLSTAEDTGETALRTIEESVHGIDDRFQRLETETSTDIGRLEESFQKRLDMLAESLSKPMQSVRKEVEERLSEALNAEHPEAIAQLASTIEQVQRRLDASESRQADAIEQMSEQVERLSKAIDARISSIESSNGGDEGLDTLKSELLDMTQRIEERLAFIETDRRMSNGTVQDMRHQLSSIDKSMDERIEKLTAAHNQSVDERISRISEENQRTIDERVANAMKAHDATLNDVQAHIAAHEDRFNDLGAPSSSDDFERLTRKIDERISESERRSADAITQIGEQVARVAERLQNQHRESLEKLEARLASSERSHKAKLDEAITGMSQRLQELGEETSNTLQPLHKNISSIAQRIADLEDANTSPPKRETQRTAPVLNDLDEDDTDVADLLGREPALPDDDDDIITTNVVGEDPPPFDESTDDQLFGSDAPEPEASADDPADRKHASDRERQDAPTAPASKIDDLLEVDDVVFQSDNDTPDFAALEAPPLQDDGDYISRARAAAKNGNKFTPTPKSSDRKAVSRGPVVASAALALAVAGGGAYSIMRGKQDESANDTFARQDPSAPIANPGDPQGAESVLFNSDDSAETAAQSSEDDTVFANAVSVGPVTDTEERPPTLAEAVAAGEPVALYDQAQELLQTGEKSRAVTMLRQAAEDGLFIASYRLAKLYERGEGVPRDMAAARRWTEQAAIGGNIRAMHDLAVFYAEGDAGPQSYAAAVEWFRQAADLGLVDSQYNLAVLFEQGLGVSEDRSEAAYWFEVAGRGGDEDALRRARALLSDMPASLSDQIRRRARAFNPKRSDLMANGDLGVRPWEQPTSAQVAEIQRLLNRLGFSAGQPDGQIGIRTTEAIRAFEEANGAAPRGDATLSLLRQLRLASPA